MSAIGTSAIAVAASRRRQSWQPVRAGNVKWRCASVFALAGIAGAFLGLHSARSLMVRALALFAIVMLVVGVLMSRRRSGEVLAVN